MTTNTEYLQLRQAIAERRFTLIPDETLSDGRDPRGSTPTLLHTSTGNHAVGVNGVISRYDLVQAKRFAHNNGDDALAMWTEELIDEIDRQSRVSSGFDRYYDAGVAPPIITRSSDQYGDKPTYGLLHATPGVVLKASDGDTPSSKSVLFHITTETLDRSNEIVEAAGGQLKRYRENPIVLWMHDQKTPAIGKGFNPRPEKSPDGVPGIVMDLVFHGETPLSKEIGVLVAKKWLNAGSIGFIPLQYEDHDSVLYADAYRHLPTVRRHKRWELIEFSIVNIPMNAGAVRRSASGVQSNNPYIGLDHDFETRIRSAVSAGDIPSDGGVCQLLERSANHRISVTSPSPDPISTPPLIVQAATDSPSVAAPANEVAPSVTTPSLTSLTITRSQQSPNTNSDHSMTQEVAINGQTTTIDEAISALQVVKSGAAISASSGKKLAKANSCCESAMGYCQKSLEHLTAMKSIHIGRFSSGGRSAPSPIPQTTVGKGGMYADSHMVDTQQGWRSKPIMRKAMGAYDNSINAAHKAGRAAVSLSRLVDNNEDNDNDTVTTSDIQGLTDKSIHTGVSWSYRPVGMFSAGTNTAPTQTPRTTVGGLSRSTEALNAVMKHLATDREGLLVILNKSIHTHSSMDWADIIGKFTPGTNTAPTQTPRSYVSRAYDCMDESKGHIEKCMAVTKGMGHYLGVMLDDDPNVAKSANGYSVTKAHLSQANMASAQEGLNYATAAFITACRGAVTLKRLLDNDPDNDDDPITLQDMDSVLSDLDDSDLYYPDNQQIEEDTSAKIGSRDIPTPDSWNAHPAANPLKAYTALNDHAEAQTEGMIAMLSSLQSLQEEVVAIKAFIDSVEGIVIGDDDEDDDGITTKKFTKKKPPVEEEEEEEYEEPEEEEEEYEDPEEEEEEYEEPEEEEEAAPVKRKKKVTKSFELTPLADTDFRRFLNTL